MAKLDIFHCVECYLAKFTHAPGIFSMEDLFYCFRCENYTDNLVETVEVDDEIFEITFEQTNFDKKDGSTC